MYKHNPVKRDRARALRRHATKSERILWAALREQQPATSLKFRRQYPIGVYIADFACLSCRLIVEIDGLSHDGKAEYDTHRDAVLAREGYHVLHFADADI